MNWTIRWFWGEIDVSRLVKGWDLRRFGVGNETSDFRGGWLTGYYWRVLTSEGIAMVPKFALGSVVEIDSHPGRTGRVMLVELLASGNRYLLDVYPGALGYYGYFVHPAGYGESKVMALNWLPECELSAAGG